VSTLPEIRKAARKAAETAKAARNMGGAVAVAYIHGDNADRVSHSWHASLTELIAHDLGSQERVIRGGWIAVRCEGDDNLPAARNTAVREFLDDRDAEWLWWVDSDMGFSPDTIDRLVAVADSITRPIVGGLCFSWKEVGGDGMGGFRCAPRPVILDWAKVDGESGFLARQAYPVNTLVQCSGTGSACILIHRSVFERIRENVGDEWYSRIPNPATPGKLFGEDLSFCMRAGAAGFPVFVHTGVRTSHHKSIWVSEPDYWSSAVAPPALEPTAIVVPVMRRPQNAAPFMASLRASTGLATVYAVVDASDPETERAWREAGADVLINSCEIGEHGTFAEKVNLAYQETDEEFLFLVGDDVRFQPGWLDHAQMVATEGRDVVGTLDLGNPRVMSGEHATHFLIRRSYVDEFGGGWDGPKVLAHEGYGHWYVDDEIIAAAKQRGAFGMAFGSVVEHLHPAYGKGEPDDVYTLGQSTALADKETFRARLAQYGGRRA
jgi:hypothetical protein